MTRPADAVGGGQGALAVLEDAVHLVRTSPGATVAKYYLGMLPLVGGLLYFWSDMSHSGLAASRLLWQSLVLAGLWVWARCWVCLFMQDLLAQMEGRASEPPAQLTGRLMLAQAATGPWALWGLTLSAIIVLPLPWVWLMSQTACLLADGKPAGDRAGLLERSWESVMSRWGRGLGLVSLLSLLCLVVFINVLATIFLPLYLAKSLLGIESFLSRGGFSPLEPTFLMIAAGITWLIVGPVGSAAATLMWQLCRSQQSGLDLLGRLRAMGRVVSPLAVLMAAAMVLAWATPAAGETRYDSRPAEVIESPQTQPIAESQPQTAASQPQTAASQSPPAKPPAKEALLADGSYPAGPVDAGQLGQLLKDVLGREPYIWRSQVEHPPSPIANWFRELWEWIAKQLHRLRWRSPGGESSWGWLWGLGPVAKVVVIVVAVAVGALLVWLAVRAARGRRRKPPVAATAVKAVVPDLNDERVMADDRPGDQWLALAQELMARGELRLALRAMFLSVLATLGERGLLRLQRGKSNRDYLHELARHAHALEGATESFAGSIRQFERCWYGRHEVTVTVMAGFQDNLARLRDAVGR